MSASASAPFYSAVSASIFSATDALLALAELGRELSPRNEGDRLASALRVLEQRIGVSRSVLYLADHERRQLSVAAAHGLSEDELRPRYGAGVAGRVAASGQPVVVPVLRHDPMALSELRHPASWSELGWSVLAVPAIVADRRAGVLCAYLKQREGQREGQLAETLRVLEVAASLVCGAAKERKSTPAEQTGQSEPAEQPEPERAPESSARSIDPQFEYANMVGASVAMKQLYEQVSQVARTNATTLIRGESGTGKELVARAIHHNSPRAAMPFVKVNCAALPEALFESELFGHERGAFTGAHARKKGRFELAQGGTLFLDEIGELPLSTQAKLLRVLQFREVERLGGTQTLHVDVRIVAATNVDMERAIAAGAFREDLYYRINIFTLSLPPLRERRADIPVLAEHFVAKLAKLHGKRACRISSGAVDLLVRYGWPGNVRELENVIERAVVVCDELIIREQHLPATLFDAEKQPEQLSLSDAVEQLERQMIDNALRTECGNVAAAARTLGTTERILRYKAQKLGVDPLRFKR
jgi:Nif-specific regulatory protein